ncbi:MAG: putative Ig domain-containing protein [Candidatus Diapherotrites archaeon]|nr:putative Ig domain-containing protein [Candidatus Diapherotrites archaeon]
MKKIVFGLILLIALFLVFGCTSPNTIPNDSGSSATPNNSGPNVTPDNGGSNNSGNGQTSLELTFLPPAVLPEAAEGTDYLYSFCKPQSAISSDWSCGYRGSPGGTTDPKGGTWAYSFTPQPSESLPEGLYLGYNGLFKGTPRIPGTYTFDICVREDQQVKLCKTTSITVAPYKQKVDYNVSITIDSADISKCKISTYYNGAWEVTAHGTMTSNVNFREGYGNTNGDKAPAVEFWMLATTAKYGEMGYTVDAEDMDCGAWKLVDKEGHLPYCEKEAGDPDTAIWKLTYSRGTIASEIVSVGASITSYNPNYYADYVPISTELTLYSKITKSAGTC